MIPIVAIVGRPNVGKSTLFNRLAGKPLAIVHDEPGVTRDRHYADAVIQGRAVTLVDTGGFDLVSGDPMGQGIARQVLGAIEEADVIVCVFDGRGAATDADRAAVQLLRRSNKPVVYLANCVDNPALELEALELHRLGVDPLLPVSALHGRGMAVLETAVVSRLPAVQDSGTTESAESLPHLALMGRPNAGKSSLLNFLSGSERSLVDARPGTTRDPVDVTIQYRGEDYVVVDTAGIRRKPRVEEGIESASVIRSLRAVQRAQIVILVVDATEGMAEQDQRLFGLCAERSRGVIVALNKLDLLDAQQREAARQTAIDALHFAAYAPIVTLSAKTGAGVSKLMQTVSVVYRQFSQRVATGELNRFFADALEHHPPPTHKGRAPRLYYITQAATSPPLFVAMCNSPEHIKTSYKRFVSNQLRQAFGFTHVPVRVQYRGRRRAE